MNKKSYIRLKPIPVQEKFKLKETKVNKFLLKFLRSIAPFYINYILKIKNIYIKNLNNILRNYKDFENGKKRILFAFRHPTGNNDPQIVNYLISNYIYKLSKKTEYKLKKHGHMHFLYSYEVPLWGSSFLKWILPRWGAYPIYHKKLNIEGMNTLRKLFKNGEYPIALAPEGHVSYLSEFVPELENGASQLCFWCLEDLHKENITKDVVILPISLRFLYEKHSWKSINKILIKTYKELNLTPKEKVYDNKSFYLSVRKLLEIIIEKIENYYKKFYNLNYNANNSINQRINEIIEYTLFICERNLNLAEKYEKKGNFSSRIQDIKQICWDRIYRKDIDSIKKLSNVDRAMSDRIAAEAFYIARHIEMVGVLIHLDETYINENSTKNRIFEFLLNLYDLLNRLKGGNISHRLKINKDIEFNIGEEINVSDFWDEYKKNRKDVIPKVTMILKERLEKLVYTSSS